MNSSSEYSHKDKDQLSQRWPNWHRVETSMGDVAVVEIPELGGKISSLQWRGREWLLQPSDSHDWSVARTQFEHAEVCGWDEMFPTISGMPDHGELWNQKWTPSPDRAKELGVECGSIPAYFGRSINAETGDHLRFDYRVLSKSQAPIRFLWAAHPLFTLEAGDELEVIGAPLVRVSGQAAVPMLAGVMKTESLVAAGSSAKWWNNFGFRSQGLRLRRGSHAVELFVDSPHPVEFGVWVDCAKISHEPSISLQPALGWHDDRKMAMENHTAPELMPGAVMEWSLHVRFQTV